MCLVYSERVFSAQASQALHFNNLRVMYNQAMSCMTSMDKSEINIRIPLGSFRDLNGILRIFLKVATKNA